MKATIPAVLFSVLACAFIALGMVYGSVLETGSRLAVNAIGAILASMAFGTFLVAKGMK